jgi:hypothetical protein
MDENFTKKLMYVNVARLRPLVKQSTEHGWMDGWTLKYGVWKIEYVRYPNFRLNG